MFEPTSRYTGVDDATLTVTDADGRQRVIAFKKRRFIPSSDGSTTLLEHTVAEGERLDIITAEYLGDPTLFWQVCDGNGVLHPAELETPGHVVRITVPGM